VAEEIVKRVPADRRKRTTVDALTYAVGHRIRVDALAMLGEGAHSPNEVATILRKNVSTVARHFKELYEGGSIELVDTRQRRGATEHFYRAVEIPEISDEEYREMSPAARLEVISLIVQAITAEVLASLMAERLQADDDLGLVWDCVNVDSKGHKEVLKEVNAFNRRMQDIKVTNAHRLAKAGEEGTTMVVVGMGFERSRPGRPECGYNPFL
jgi:DNA-binding transcriptional ArsR family regulator